MTSLAKFEDWISEDVDARFTEDEHTYYLSGPMSGKPDFNFPLFRRAAKTLRERGFNILSPVEMDEFIADLPPWPELIGRDVTALIKHCDGIIMLPDWAASPGSRIELFVAITQGMALFEYTDTQEWLPVMAPIRDSWAMQILREETIETSTVL